MKHGRFDKTPPCSWGHTTGLYQATIAWSSDFINSRLLWKSYYLIIKRCILLGWLLLLLSIGAHMNSNEDWGSSLLWKQVRQGTLSNHSNLLAYFESLGRVHLVLWLWMEPHPPLPHPASPNPPKQKPLATLRILYPILSNIHMRLPAPNLLLPALRSSSLPSSNHHHLLINRTKHCQCGHLNFESSLYRVVESLEETSSSHCRDAAVSPGCAVAATSNSPGSP